MSHSKKEYTGKDVDEAVAAACVSCKCRREDLEIEIVSKGSAGIFGLCKRKAIILAARKAKEQTAVEPQASPRQAPTTKREARPPREREHRHHEGEDSQPVAAESLEGIRELLSTILGLMAFRTEVSMTASGNKVTASIVSLDQGADIVGHSGATIDAIQYLLRKIITQKFPEKIHLTLDVGSYRADRHQELVSLALELAAKVKATGKSQIIGALSSPERRIIHIALQEDTAVRSVSIGEGLFKKVRISLPGQNRKHAHTPEREPSPLEEDSAEP